MCGPRSISWADLGLFAFCMVDNDFEQYLYKLGIPSGKDKDSESGCIRARKIDGIKDYNHSSPHKTTFLNGLVEARGAQAADPRDKIFAIMGLTNTQMYPNYSLKVIDVYTEAALKMKTALDLADLLCCVDHPQPTPSKPSWVSDWATPRQIVSLGYNAWHHKVYQATKQSKMQWRTDITERCAALIIPGVIADTITNVGMAPEEPNLKDILNPETLTNRFVLEGMNLAIELCQPYPSSRWTIFEAFCQTMVAGKDHSSIAKAPDEFLQSSPSFLTRLQVLRLLFQINHRSLPNESLPLRIYK